MGDATDDSPQEIGDNEVDDHVVDGSRVDLGYRIHHSPFEVVQRPSIID